MSKITQSRTCQLINSILYAVKIKNKIQTTFGLYLAFGRMNINCSISTRHDILISVILLAVFCAPACG